MAMDEVAVADFHELFQFRACVDFVPCFLLQPAWVAEEEGVLVVPVVENAQFVAFGAVVGRVLGAFRFSVQGNRVFCVFAAELEVFAFFFRQIVNTGSWILVDCDLSDFRFGAKGCGAPFRLIPLTFYVVSVRRRSFHVCVFKTLIFAHHRSNAFLTSHFIQLLVNR